MNTQRFPKPLLAFILVILAFQVVANYFYWYWRIWWFDMPMHFAGGLWVGLSALWFVFLSGRFKRNPQQNTLSVLIIGVFSVLAIAILWEIFEYGVQIVLPRGTPHDILDTTIDIFLGLVGGLVASFAFLRKGYLEK